MSHRLVRWGPLLVLLALEIAGLGFVERYAFANGLGSEYWIISLIWAAFGVVLLTDYRGVLRLAPFLPDPYGQRPAEYAWQVFRFALGAGGLVALPWSQM